jgi:hypothetical protein
MMSVRSIARRYYEAGGLLDAAARKFVPAVNLPTVADASLPKQPRRIMRRYIPLPVEKFYSPRSGME